MINGRPDIFNHLRDRGVKAFILLLAFFLVSLFYGEASSQIVTSFDSRIDIGGTPVKMNIDKTGLLYVVVKTGSTGPGYLVVYNTNNGSIEKKINVSKYLISIAFDENGKIYAGEHFKNGTGSVSVYAPDGQYLYSLGIGVGEFGSPQSMVVANGLLYVVDSINNVVKVYGTDNGSFRFSFGGYGVGNGQFVFPSGIAYDSVNGEIYVSNYTTDHARVQVFTPDGVYKRTIGVFGGYGPGNLTKPHGVYVYENRVYIADIYQNHIAVFDRLGNFIDFIGTFGWEDGEIGNPTDVVMSGTRLFVANYFNSRIEAFNVLDPNGLILNPSSLSFTAFANSNPPVQSVIVDSQVSGNQVNWTASTSSSFITLSQTSGTTPSTVDIGINPAGLSGGTYTGEVLFTSGANGFSYPVKVNLTVIEARLIVSPSVLYLHHQRNGEPPSGIISITGDGGSLEWSASTNVPWLSLSSLSGTTPANLVVSVNSNAESLDDGIYAGVVTINSPNALDSPAVIAVTLNIVSEGTIVVRTNLNEASFVIKGPENYSGSGLEWKKEGAKAGEYNIEFGFVMGYRKPVSRTFQLDSARTVVVSVEYKKMPVANVIVAAKGAYRYNDATIRVFDLNGGLINEFKAFTNMFGARVATGDVDGDGSYEIIATTGHSSKNSAFMRIFRHNGTLLSSVGPFTNTAFGAVSASGDIDGDGRYEVAMSILSKDGLLQTIVLYSFDGLYRTVEIGRIALPSSIKLGSPANVSFGDVNGDGRLELIVSRQSDVSIYSFDDNMTPSLQINSPTSSIMTVSSGDINADGSDEILLGYADENANSIIKALSSDMTDNGFYINAFANGMTSPNLSSMDSNGDGIIEILAGKGSHILNNAVLRIFSIDGSLLKEFDAFRGFRFGVNAAFGFIGN